MNEPEIVEQSATSNLIQPWWTWVDEPIAVLAFREEESLVACVRIFGRVLECDSTKISCGGIGGLYTLPSFRTHGCFGYRLIEAAYAHVRDVLGLPAVVFYSRLPFYEHEYAHGRGYVPLKNVGTEKLWAKSLVPWLTLKSSERWTICPPDHF